MSEKLNIEDLKNRLPYGYAKILQKRIKERYGKNYLERSIYRSLSKINSIVLDEAILLVKEMEERRASISKYT